MFGADQKPKVVDILRVAALYGRMSSRLKNTSQAENQKKDGQLAPPFF